VPVFEVGALPIMPCVLYYGKLRNVVIGTCVYDQKDSILTIRGEEMELMDADWERTKVAVGWIETEFVFDDDESKYRRLKGKLIQGLLKFLQLVIKLINLLMWNCYLPHILSHKCICCKLVKKWGGELKVQKNQKRKVKIFKTKKEKKKDKNVWF
jgi:hypothetical protein